MAQTASARDQHGYAIAALEIARTSAISSVRSWALNSRGALEDDPDAATEFWLEALGVDDAYGIATAAGLLIELADDAGEELDDEVAERITAAAFNSHPPTDGARQRLQVLLATLAERRRDIDTLRELFQNAEGDAAPRRSAVRAGFDRGS
jgi:hypothetical protein